MTARGLIVGSSPSVNYGEVVLDFGHAGTQTNLAEAVVADQPDVDEDTCFARAWMAASVTDENSRESHIIAASQLELLVGKFIEGVGFSVYGVSPGGIAGKFRVKYAWERREN